MKNNQKHFKKTAVIISAAAIAIAAVICIIVAMQFDKSAAKINGESVTIEELAMYAEGIKASVNAEISKENGLTATGKSFWRTEYNGVTPGEVLFDKALALAVRDNLIRAEARRLSVSAPKSYNELKAMHKKDAETRAEGSEIFYGPSTLTLEQFNTSIMQTCTDDLKKVLLEGELAPELEDLQAAFDSLDTQVRQAEFSVEGSELIPNEGITAQEIAQLIEGGASMEDISKSAEIKPFSLVSAEVHREDLNNIALMNLLVDAEAGESVVFNETVYHIEKKEGGGLLKLEEAPRLAESKYINDAFERLIAERQAKADISANKKLLDEFLKALNL